MPLQMVGCMTQGWVVREQGRCGDLPLHLEYNCTCKIGNRRRFLSQRNAENSDGDYPLLAWIRGRIEESGPVTVARFMEWALYHPELGYYSVGPRIGPRGDFTT